MSDTFVVTYEQASPAEVLEGAARGNAEAWKVVVGRHGRMVQSIARSIVLSEADVADVTQTVWLRLFEHIDSIEYPERVGSWLARTTRNECMRVLRQRSRMTVVEDEGVLDSLAGVSITDAKVETHDRDVQLRRAVATLPSQSQALLGLLMSDPSPSYGQVAAQLGMAVGSIGPTRQRCLRALHAKCTAASIGPA